MKCFLEAVILTLNLPLLFSRFCLLQCNFFFQPFTLLSRPSIWASPTALPTSWERCTTLAPSPSPTFYSATPMNRKRNGTSLQRWHSQRMGWSTSRPTWQRTCPPKSFTREKQKKKKRLKVKKANRKWLQKHKFCVMGLDRSSVCMQCPGTYYYAICTMNSFSTFVQVQYKYIWWYHKIKTVVVIWKWKIMATQPNLSNALNAKTINLKMGPKAPLSLWNLEYI